MKFSPPDGVQGFVCAATSPNDAHIATTVSRKGKRVRFMVSLQAKSYTARESGDGDQIMVTVNEGELPS